MDEWIRSSYCDTSSCVEVLFWRKSSFSGPWTDNCVEVAEASDEVLVRDSKLGSQSPILRFTRDEWDSFVKGVQAGEFG